MKKIALIALALVSMSMLNATKLTNIGTKTPEGKPVETEKITVKNMTGRPVYAAVYIKDGDDKDAQLFGDFYGIADGETEKKILRPKWGKPKRAYAEIKGIDRVLYFTFNRPELTVDLVKEAVPRKNKQFIKIGNNEGEDFVIYAIDEDKKPNIAGQNPAAAKKKDWDDLSKDY